MKSANIVFFVVIGLLSIHAAIAQDGSIITDRPDLTESTAVVGKNRFQIETSFLYERSTEGLDEEGYFTPTLLRYGLTDDLEIRLETDLFSHSSAETLLGDQNTSGYSPLSFGLKYFLFDVDQSFFASDTSVLVNVGTPTGSSTFASDDVTGEIKLLLDWELTDTWGVGANAGVVYDVDDSGDGFIAGTATLALGHDWTDRFGSFWEVAYQGPASSRDEHELIFDTGITYLLNPDAQIDLAIGTGLAGDTGPDVFVTAGLSLRF